MRKRNDPNANAATALATTTPEGKPFPLDGARLDAAVSSIRGKFQSASKALWQVGRELAAIREQGLHRARHETFAAFVETELGMTARHARNYIDVASKFTEAQLEEHGVRGLLAIGRAPEQIRPLLLDYARTVSVEELEGAIREIQTIRQPRVVACTAPKKSRLRLDADRACTLVTDTVRFACRIEEDDEGFWVLVIDAREAGETVSPALEAGETVSPALEATP